MTKRLKQIFLIVPIFVMVFGGFMLAPTTVSANGQTAQQKSGTSSTGSTSLGICTFIPSICTALGGSAGGISAEQTTSFLKSRLTTVVSLVFIGIILISVFIILRAGIKYIQSQGDPGKIQEAQKAITSVFVGIAILFVGIIGLFIVLAFFNATALVDTSCTIGADGKIECPTSGN